LDQSEHGLSKFFGKLSPELKAFKTSRSELYDSNWGYRFMEALRNHVQHYGLAAHSIIHKSFLSSGDDPDYIEYTVHPQVTVKRLRENGKFKKAVLDECPDSGNEIDLRIPIREYVSCLTILHRRFRSTIEKSFTESRLRYKRAVERFSMILHKEVNCPSLRELSNTDKVSDEVALVSHFLDYYDDLFVLNAVNDDISNSTASNTTQKRQYHPKA
jgi:hypothetical protein